METIITIFTVLSMYMSAAQNVDSKYYYNADIENGIVKTLYVFDKSDNCLNKKMAYHFDYDEMGRLTEKTVCKWNQWKNEYKPDYRLQLTYCDNSYEVLHTKWDAKHNEWKSNSEKAIYHIDNGHLLSVNYLRMDTNGDFQFVDHLRILDPFDGLLLAEIEK